MRTFVAHRFVVNAVDFRRNTKEGDIQTTIRSITLVWTSSHQTIFLMIISQSAIVGTGTDRTQEQT